MRSSLFAKFLLPLLLLAAAAFPAAAQNPQLSAVVNYALNPVS